ncbi:MAG: AI-2E family transporter [Actinobacteria bacterium]|nr:AI-2E family transporter [Actinomycetota bacterium]
MRGLITMPVGTLNYVTETPGSDASMPRWVPRAVLLLWLGYLGTVLVQELWDRLFGFLLLLVIALFIALAIEPGTNRLARRGMRRGTATGLILAGVAAVALGFVAVMGALIADQASELSDNRDAYVVDVVDFLNDTFGTDLDSAEILDSIDDPQGPVREFLNSQADRAVQLGVSAFSTLFQVFSILLFTFYFAADGPRLRRTICSWLRPQRQRVVLDVWELAVDKTGGYLSSRAILAVVSSFLHWIAFQAIGTPAPIALALWVGVVSQFLPVIGIYVAGALPLLLTVIDSPLKALFVLGFIVVYQQIENFLIAPKITAQKMQLHAGVAFASAIIGGAVLGPTGAILGLPAAAVIQGVLSSVGERYEVVDDGKDGAE